MANKYKYIGIGFSKRLSKYYSCISIDRKLIVIGYGESPLECAKLRDLYIIKHNLDTTKHKLQIIKPKIQTT